MGFFGGILFSASTDWLRAERNKLVSKLEAGKGNSLELQSKIDEIENELKRRQEESK